MGQKDESEYLEPFYAPRLSKWVIVERGALAAARRGACNIPLYLFDEQKNADTFYLTWKLKGTTPAGSALH